MSDIVDPALKGTRLDATGPARRAASNPGSRTAAFGVIKCREPEPTPGKPQARNGPRPIHLDKPVGNPGCVGNTSLGAAARVIGESG